MFTRNSHIATFHSWRIVSFSAFLLLLLLSPGLAHADPDGLAGTYSQGALDTGGGENPNLITITSTLGSPMLPPDVNTGFVDPQGSSSSVTAAVAIPNPIGMDRVTFRYFSYNGSIVPLIGVSADAACHMHLANAYGDLCNFDSGNPGYYVKVLNDAASKGLNKIRLWVAINGGSWQGKPTPACTQAVVPNVADQPFLYNACVGTCPGGLGTWFLDQRNPQYFTDLQQVVAYAKSLNIFVEVTLFAPWIGAWELSPWHPNHARVSTNPTNPIGFTDRSYFVRCDGACANNPTSPNEQMRGYQVNIIKWTVDALWSYDNVYWEVANEPEAWLPATDCGLPTPQPAEGTDPSFIAWQSAVAGFLYNYENQTYVATGMLARPHLIAVQPFSPQGTVPYLTNADVAVINGHYTTVDPKQGGQGAIQLAQADANQSRLLGFNEGKISGTGPTNFNVAAQEASCGLDAAKSIVDCTGEPESARAEAWEFMLSGGASVDHFGYYWSSTYGTAVRQQLGALRTFVAALPLRQLTTTAITGTGPGWINMGAYASGNKYWTGLQPTASASTRTWALYIHHSEPRTNAGGSFLKDQGYLPLVVTSPEYQEMNLKLCLGAAAGKYKAQWINPATGAAIGAVQKITWAGSSSCANGGVGSIAVNASPLYTYDIALLVTPQ
jgi:hypothetical protein